MNENEKQVHIYHCEPEGCKYGDSDCPVALPDKSRWGVHETHCCPIHGCKYSSDNCPVFLGYTRAEYMCEDCDDDAGEYQSYVITFTDGRGVYPCRTYKEMYDAVNDSYVPRSKIKAIEAHTVHNILRGSR